MAPPSYSFSIAHVPQGPDKEHVYVLLATNFSDQKLLVAIVTNLYTNLQNKKIIGY